MALWIPEYVQTKVYSAMRVRQVLMDQQVQEGVVGTGDLKVTQRVSGGANMSVDVAPGSAFVKGDLTSRQGLYHIYNDAVVNLTFAGNATGNPRVDQVVARVYDTQDQLDGVDQATVEVLQGTETAGATLSNRTGAATVPLTAVRLADVLVPSGATSILNSAIIDRRPWARGAYSFQQRTTGNVTSSAMTTPVQVVADFQARLEFNATTLARVKLHGYATIPNVAYSMFHYVMYDGAFIQPRSEDRSAGGSTAIDYEWVVPVTQGSHLFGLGYNGVGTSATTTWVATATSPFQFIVEEIIQPNSNNGTA